MVQFVLHALFDVCEIDYHAIFVQFFCTAIHSDNAVVTMRSRAFALIVQFELVRVGNFDTFGDVIHEQFELRIGQPSAKILILCDMNKPEGWWFALAWLGACFDYSARGRWLVGCVAWRFVVKLRGLCGL